MLYQGNQLGIFLLTFLSGVVASTVWVILALVCARVKSKIFLGVKDVVAVLVVGGLLVASLVGYNFGVVRGYLLVAYFVGFWASYKIYKFVLAKTRIKLYNFSNK